MAEGKVYSAGSSYPLVGFDAQVPVAEFNHLVHFPH